MQKRKFDELISHFNRKVSDMSIDQKYKMELLGMISAIGFAHEKELSTNLASLGTDAISRQQAIKATWQDTGYTDPFNVMTAIRDRIKQLPPIQPKRGKWIIKDDTERFIAQCNCCRYIEDSRRIKNFCPNCGAKMEVTNGN